MRVIAAAVLAVLACPAFAQSGPAFDCAKAANAVEQTICKDPELAKADRAMVLAYTALVGKLAGAARDQLVKDQLRWIADRNRGCAIDTDGIAPCLKSRYEARTTNLRALADGVYPFIGEQSIATSGKLGKITYSIDIGYPAFEGKTADFAAINARFANAAKKAADEATPKADSGVDREQGWTYEQGFTLYRPGAQAITVAVNFYGYSGGAHGYGATRCTLVDLRTGKATGPEGVFAAGAPWLKTMVEIVGADLKKQFVTKPGFEDALQPAKLATLLREADNYCWRSNRLELIFNAYEVGPYSSGPFEVYVPYDRLKPLLRGDGPITR